MNGDIPHYGISTSAYQRLIEDLRSFHSPAQQVEIDKVCEIMERERAEAQALACRMASASKGGRR